jgi:XTP/dITP diphosphohydrolase
MTTRLRLVAATANRAKLAEMAEILDAAGVELAPRPPEVPEIVEDGATLWDNAVLKATAIAAACGEPAVADDTGLEVDALGGAPGVRSARYAGETATDDDNVDRLLRELDGTDDRRAAFRTVAVVVAPDGTLLAGTEGVCAGVITTARRGEGGFGYDPVFVPDEGDGRTFAEMTPADKHRISHRGRAFRALAAALGTAALDRGGA